MTTTTTRIVAPDNVGTVDANGVLWKATSTPGVMMDKFGDYTNLYETIAASCKLNLDRPAAGARPVIRTEQVDGFEKVVLGDYNFQSYSQYFEEVENFGKGIAATLPGLAKGDVVCLYMETRREWMQAAYGAWRQGLTVATIYATLGEEGALYGINQSKCKAVVADGKLLKILSKVASKFTCLKDVISIEEPPADAAAALKSAGISLHTWKSITEAGKAKDSAPDPCGTDGIAVLMYTSGTTGNPKGVLISHKSILCVVATTTGSNSALNINGKNYLRADSVYLAYLPLAHIMEMAVEVSIFSIGCKVGFGGPGTLAATSPKMLQTKPPQLGDAALLQPTVFVAAPAVLDKLLIAIKAKFAAAPGFVQGQVAKGIESGKANYINGGVGSQSCLAKIIFKKAQKLIGGKVELMLTGSAPLAAEVQMFVQTVFNCRVRQGYGLTETCAATCIALATDNSVTCVGPPQETACIKLRDWEEGGYRNADKDGEIKMRRGEVLIGGPTVCAGYLVDEANPDPEIVAKNNEDFTTIDGIRYFCTGDIGQFTASGNLQIIDRKKDLVKLQMGEYVALSKVENAIKVSKYTALPMTVATSDKSYCIALICPNHVPLKQLADSIDVQGSISELCANQKVIDAVLADVTTACKGAKLSKFEIPTKIALIDELWTPDNDMLTAVQKLKRRPIAEKHKAQIDAIYT